MSLLPEITADRFESSEQLTPAVLQAADMLGMYGAELARILGLQCDAVGQMRAARQLLGHEGKARQRAVLFGRFYRALHKVMKGDEAAMCHWIRAESPALGGVPLLLMVDEGRLADVLGYLENPVVSGSALTLETRSQWKPKVSSWSKPMDEKTRIELEAAAFRGLVEHLRRRTDVQNIDLMNLAGFCRNCLSKWYMGAANERGIDMTYDDAREVVYGMPYAVWKEKYQTEATPEQKQAFEETKPLHAFVSGHNKS